MKRTCNRLHPTLTTDVTSFPYGSLAATVDGVTSGSGSLAYAVVPDHADGKFFKFKLKAGSFIMDRLVFHNRNDVGANTTTTNRILGSRLDFFLEGVLVATEIMNAAGNAAAHVSTWTAARGMEIDEIQLVFSGDIHNFREIQIFGTALIKHPQNMTGAPDTAMAVGTDHQRHANASHYQWLGGFD
jgi:hypothetical protein